MAKREEEKPTILVTNSKKNSPLDPQKDVDLQPLSLSKFDSPKRGKEEALNKINSLTGLSLKESDFTPSYWQTDMMTGKKNEPVEWSCTKEGKYNKMPGRWTVEMNMDDPTPDSVGADVPHIGYRVDFDDGTRARKIQAGHVFVNSVPASRLRPREKDAFKNRR